MKKLLITSTALVATGGFAFADGHAGISLSGNAEMGIANVDDGAGPSGDDPHFHQDVDVTFSLKGETDGGLSFGASVDLDEAGDLDATTGTNHATPNAGTGASVFLSGGFGTLTMGDTDGALDWAMTETAMGTAIADDHTLHAGYSGNSEMDRGNMLRYDNTFGDFGVAVSLAEIENDDINTQLGVKYSADLGGTTLGLGLGYATQGDDDLLGLSVSTSIAGFSVVLNYKDGEIGGADATHMGIGIGYSVDALSFHANWGDKDDVAGERDGYGLNVNYDLGGGAVVALGYGSDDAADRYSLGLRMDF